MSNPIISKTRFIKPDLPKPFLASSTTPYAGLIIEAVEKIRSPLT